MELEFIQNLIEKNGGKLMRCRQEQECRGIIQKLF